MRFQHFLAVLALFSGFSSIQRFQHFLAAFGTCQRFQHFLAVLALFSGFITFQQFQYFVVVLALLSGFSGFSTFQQFDDDETKILVLLSASVERFGISSLRDFLCSTYCLTCKLALHDKQDIMKKKQCNLKLKFCSLTTNYYQFTDTKW